MLPLLCYQVLEPFPFFIFLNPVLIYFPEIWSLFNFRNKFVKEFAISKGRLFKLSHENFWEEKNHLCKFRTLELS